MFLIFSDLSCNPSACGPHDLPSCHGHDGDASGRGDRLHRDGPCGDGDDRRDGDDPSCRVHARDDHHACVRGDDDRPSCIHLHDDAHRGAPCILSRHDGHGSAYPS